MEPARYLLHGSLRHACIFFFAACRVHVARRLPVHGAVADIAFSRNSVRKLPRHYLNSAATYVIQWLSAKPATAPWLVDRRPLGLSLIHI
eukprot:4654235-Pyramimonas_sp.AAC.1